MQKNYFQLFDLPETCELNIDALAVAYRELQSEVHPDRFATASESEKLLAVQQSSYLNEAYSTLKSPLKRAGYLLVQNNIDIGKVDQNDLSMELLLEQIQLREMLDELPKDASALADLESLKKDVQEKLRGRYQDFSDSTGKSNFPEAKIIYHELQFLYKLLAEIESGEEQRLEY